MSKKIQSINSQAFTHAVQHDISKAQEQLNKGIVTTNDVQCDLSKTQEQLNKGLVFTMAQGISQFTSSISRITQLSDKLLSHFETQLDDLIKSDTLPFDDTLSILDKVQTKQIQILDLIRKITQGKPIVQNNLTYEERVVVQLFNSFSSKTEKSKFLHLVESQLGVESPSFEEVPNDSTPDASTDESND